MSEQVVAWDMEAEHNIPKGKEKEGDSRCVWGPTA